MIHTPETDAAEAKRRDDESSAQCFAGHHIPVRCSVTNEVMCNHCGEHGLQVELVLDIGAVCKVHQADLDARIATGGGIWRLS